MPRAHYIPSKYRATWRKAWTEGVIDVYGTSDERLRRREQEKELIAQWPADRIRGLADKCGVTQPRIAALLGLNKKTFERLRMGRFTPSFKLCRRMGLLEDHAERGILYPKLVPQRSEMRRRLILFRAWWFTQGPKQRLPEADLRISVKWGKSRIQTIELPVTLLPRMKLTKWEGLAELVQAVTVAARRVAHANGKIAWQQGEKEFWERYANDTLPAQIEARIAKHKASRQ